LEPPNLSRPTTHLHPHRAIRKLHAEDPRRRIYLTGFSLGANVILKALGELGDEAPRLGVVGAAVACVPFDAVRSSSKIDTGFNRLVYAANFLKTLKVKAARKHAQHASEDGQGPYDLERVLSCTKIGDFDDECVLTYCWWWWFVSQAPHTPNIYITIPRPHPKCRVIAKLHGFEDKIDYYRQSCSKQYLPHIRVPALVVNALDDPFINEEGLPAQADVGAAPLRLVYHKHGGHCGFIAGDERPGTPEEDRWLPIELARFLLHVDAPFRGVCSQEEEESVVGDGGDLTTAMT
jgi:predicted alpha/beta-fold hydrolase